jgi:small subunit ribosomal protein S8
MSMNDVLSDVLTRIRNGQMAYAYEVRVPFSKLVENVLVVLKQEGYIEGHEKVELSAGVNELKVQLRYHEGKPAIRQLKRVSTPGRRAYRQVRDLPRPQNGLGISIISTSRGVMTDHDARQAKVGGEVLCTVF